MFNPEDKKPKKTGRSLFDLLPDAQTPARTAQQADATGNRARPVNPSPLNPSPVNPRPVARGLLLDSLYAAIGEPATPVSDAEQPAAQTSRVEQPAAPASRAQQPAAQSMRVEQQAASEPVRNEPIPSSAAAPVQRRQTRRSDVPAQGETPLIDVRKIIASVWRLRGLIVATTLLGAILGVVIAIMLPSTYVAESKLYVDPREVRLTDSDLSKGSLATEAILALVDSQLEVLRSRTVLEKVAADLGLDRDAEFGVKTGQSGGLAAGIDVIRKLLSPPVASSPAAASGVNPQTLDALSKAVTVTRDPKTFIVIIQVQTRDPAKSALIANSIVSTFFNEEQSAQSGFFQRTTAALDSRLADLRTELDTAENAVEKYKADHDIVDASGQLISDKQLLALNDQVGAVRNRIADAKAKAEVANKIQLNDVLSGAFPEEVSSVALQELRKQYSTARAQLGSLDASLGPRHPQRLAASQALEVARSEIGNELRRIAATTQTELQRALATEQDLVGQLAAQKAEQVGSSTDSIQLRELQRKANATRAIYESFLKRASETGEEEKLTSRNIRVISSAEPPLQPKGPSRKLVVIAGVVLGFMLGVGIGVMLGIVQSLRDLLRRPDVEDDRPVIETAPRLDGPPPVQQTTRPYDDEMPLMQTAAKPLMPSAHHAAAFSAARSVLPAGLPADESAGNPDVEQVRSDLRALRTRVETYARQRERSTN